MKPRPYETGLSPGVSPGSHPHGPRSSRSLEVQASLQGGFRIFEGSFDVGVTVLGGVVAVEVTGHGGLWSRSSRSTC